MKRNEMLLRNRPADEMHVECMRQHPPKPQKRLLRLETPQPNTRVCRHASCEWGGGRIQPPKANRTHRMANTPVSRNTSTRFRRIHRCHMLSRSAARMTLGMPSHQLLCEGVVAVGYGPSATTPSRETAILLRTCPLPTPSTTHWLDCAHRPTNAPTHYCELCDMACCHACATPCRSCCV